MRSLRDAGLRKVALGETSVAEVLEHTVGYEPAMIDSLWDQGGTQTIQWTPDRSGWLLFNHLLVDRDSGAVVWKLPPEPRFSGEGKNIAVTASFGLCGLDRVPAGERHLAERVLKIADAALYRSKHSGRNRVTATIFNAGGE